MSIQNEYLQQLKKAPGNRVGNGNTAAAFPIAGMNGAALMLFRILAGGTENINFLMKSRSVHSSVKILTLLYSRITF